VSEIRELLRELVIAEIRFIVVGGVAVVLHGHLRATKDLDLVVDPDPDAARHTIRVLLEMGLRPTAPVNALDFADTEIRRSWIEEKNMVVFQMTDPADPRKTIDLFAEPPFDFEEMWTRSLPVRIDDLIVRVASVSHLIAMKRHSGRPLDLDDIAQLEKLENFRGST
jgi:hypothetical protein